MMKRNLSSMMLIVLLPLLACSASKNLENAIETEPVSQFEILAIDSPKEVITIPQYDSVQLKNEYRVALLLPFQTDKIKLDSLGNPEGIPSSSRMAIEFYEGVRLALDSLQQEGINLKLFVYDTEGDTNHLKVILTDPELKLADLIIGPVYNSELSIASKFALQNKIYMVSPLSSTTSMIAGNPYFISANASIKSHCESMFDYMTQKYQPKKIFFLYRDIDNEKNIESYFEEFEKQYESDTKTNIQFVRLTDSISKSYSNLLNTFSPTEENIIIVPSYSETYVYSITKTLNALATQRKIILFGMPTWKDFESLQLGWMDTLHAHITSTNWYQKSDSSALKLMSDFESKYEIKPTDYSMQGYDVMQFFGEEFLNYGINVTMNIQRKMYQTLNNRFRFEPVLKSNDISIEYFENKYVFILNFWNGDIKVLNRQF